MQQEKCTPRIAAERENMYALVATCPVMTCHAHVMTIYKNVNVYQSYRTGVDLLTIPRPTERIRVVPSMLALVVDVVVWTVV